MLIACWISVTYTMDISCTYLFDPFPPLYDHFSTYIYFLVTLRVPSVTRYAFFDGIHISHTYCIEIFLAIVNYFLYYVRDENKWIELKACWCRLLSTGDSMSVQLNATQLRRYHIGTVCCLRKIACWYSLVSTKDSTLMQFATCWR